MSKHFEIIFHVCQFVDNSQEQIIGPPKSTFQLCKFFLLLLESPCLSVRSSQSPLHHGYMHTCMYQGQGSCIMHAPKWSEDACNIYALLHHIYIVDIRIHASWNLASWIHASTDIWKVEWLELNICQHSHNYTKQQPARKLHMTNSFKIINYDIIPDQALKLWNFVHVWQPCPKLIFAKKIV